MDEIWERAVETSLDGQTNIDLVTTLTLDGVVKCVHGRLPPLSLFEKFHNLQHLSLANIDVSSLEQFPRLRNLQKLILSDNRIAGGLEHLVEAGLESLRDLDLSNNRISDINDLRPLAELSLVSMDLYECPVTRVKDYRSRVFGLIRSLKYLDKMDAEENERPESDDEDSDDDEEEDEEEDDEDDPGSGEIDGEDRPFRLNNGQSAGSEGVVDVDEEEESDADEEETKTARGVNGVSCVGSSHHHSNGFSVEPVDGEEDEEEGEDDDDSVEEVYEDDEGEDEDVVEVHELDDTDDGVDVVDDDGDGDDDEDEDEEEVDNDERDSGEPESSRWLGSTEGEIDGHEQGEDDADEDDDGETGEEEQAVEEDGEYEDEEDADDEEDDYGSGYLVQPVGRVEVDAGAASDMGEEGEDPEIEDDDIEVEDDEDGEVQELAPSSSSHKRKRDDDDYGGGGGGEGEDDDDDNEDDIGQFNKSSKHQ